MLAAANTKPFGAPNMTYILTSQSYLRWVLRIAHVYLPDTRVEKFGNENSKDRLRGIIIRLYGKGRVDLLSRDIHLPTSISRPYSRCEVESEETSCLATPPPRAASTIAGLGYKLDSNLAICKIDAIADRNATALWE